MKIKIICQDCLEVLENTFDNVYECPNCDYGIEVEVDL